MFVKISKEEPPIGLFIKVFSSRDFDKLLTQ